MSWPNSLFSISSHSTFYFADILSLQLLSSSVYNLLIPVQLPFSSRSLSEITLWHSESVTKGNRHSGLLLYAKMMVERQVFLYSIMRPQTRLLFLPWDCRLALRFDFLPNYGNKQDSSKIEPTIILWVCLRQDWVWLWESLNSWQATHLTRILRLSIAFEGNRRRAMAGNYPWDKQVSTRLQTFQSS